ncbi:GNAT family N-acetyltransferase [Sutcliffiella halmapala]|uniref:GNAT family N-acetyltransferase n=1 Tax=Sutcliffiella halmapala TaxID=79882 RepID=UPI0009957473|nr:GNAT family N-acetyltransferase [Sutcliffiella halmapala]
MTKDYKLMEIQADVLFKHDSLGRMTEINEPLNIDGPFFFLGRTKEGNVVRFHNSFPNLKMKTVLEVINNDERNVDLGKIIEVINEIKAISSIWIGPAYVFPESFNMNSNAVKITNENKELLIKDFPNLFKQFEWRQPCFAIIADGNAVSVCCSARKSTKAAEASVETLEGYKGKGYGTNSVIAWGNELKKEGLQPLYSTAWDNFSSQSIAKKLGLHKYGVDFHLS